MFGWHAVGKLGSKKIAKHIRTRPGSSFHVCEVDITATSTDPCFFMIPTFLSMYHHAVVALLHSKTGLVST